MFVKWVKSKKIRYKYALGMRDTDGKEFHSFHEIFFLLNGSASFTSDSNFDFITSNTVVIIPKCCFHQYEPLCDEGGYLRGVLQFDSLPETDLSYENVLESVRVIKNPDKTLMDICKKMNGITQSKICDEDKVKLLQSYFYELMIELKYNLPEYKSENKHEQDISLIISYIDEHFSENISIGDIAKTLNFSKSSVSHKFQKVFHISIYNYIMKKKLTYAYGMLSDGKHPTEVAYKCGFSDYSGFYKMYKKYFGFSPSDTQSHL